MDEVDVGKLKELVSQKIKEAHALGLGHTLVELYDYLFSEPSRAKWAAELLPDVLHEVVEQPVERGSLGKLSRVIDFRLFARQCSLRALEEPSHSRPSDTSGRLHFFVDSTEVLEVAMFRPWSEWGSSWREQGIHGYIGGAWVADLRALHERVKLYRAGQDAAWDRKWTIEQAQRFGIDPSLAHKSTAKAGPPSTDARQPKSFRFWPLKWPKK
jgi:hypothetical protein